MNFPVFSQLARKLGFRDEFAQRTVSDRGSGDGCRLLLPSGGDLGRVLCASLGLFCDDLAARLGDPDAGRNRVRGDQLYCRPAVGPGDQGQGTGTGSRCRVIISCGVELPACRSERALRA